MNDQAALAGVPPVEVLVVVQPTSVELKFSFRRTSGKFVGKDAEEKRFMLSPGQISVLEALTVTVGAGMTDTITGIGSGFEQFDEFNVK